MYLLRGLEYFQLQLLLNSPRGLVNESLVGEGIAEIDSSTELPDGVVGLNDGGEALDTEGAVENVELAELEDTDELDTVVRHVPGVLYVKTLEDDTVRERKVSLYD